MRLRFLLLLLPLAVACGGDPNGSAPAPELATREDAVAIPAKGTASTLDVASWNIEWFGDTANGPTNETLQLQNARDVILGSDMDIWGVAEIVSLSHWNSLESQLPGYTGFLANESNVINGATYYSD
ncbi:MAG TPA: endonuclease, partial [Myxococcaceae bacterium]|nr:endonuclease [Myxococcaceae bacterium]